MIDQASLFGQASKFSSRLQHGEAFLVMLHSQDGELEGIKGPYLLMSSCKVLLLWVPILPVVAAKV